jgi:hypothetical protein
VGGAAPRLQASSEDAASKNMLRSPFCENALLFLLSAEKAIPD